MDLGLDDGIALINKAFEKREEQKAWNLYASLYPHFTKNTFVVFSEFYSPSQKAAEYEQKSEGEILSEVKAVLDSLKG